MAAAMLGVLFWLPFAAASSSSDVGDRVAETLAEHPFEYSNALFGAMQSESAVLGFPGDGLFTAKAELVNAGETGYAVYLTADPASAGPDGEAVHYHFAGAEKKGGADRAGKLGDLFVLGDFRKPYYLNTADVDDRDRGLVYIFYFDTDHATVQLHGSSSDYELVELDELPKAETRGGGRFGRGDRGGGGESRFAERILGRIGRDQGSRGGTAIVWRETLDVVGVLVGVSIDDLEGGLTGRAFTYDTPPSGQAAYPTGVQVSHAGLSAGGASQGNRIWLCRDQAEEELVVPAGDLASALDALSLGEVVGVLEQVQRDAAESAEVFGAVVAAFCRERGLTVSSFHAWRRRLRRRRESPSPVAGGR